MVIEAGAFIVYGPYCSSSVLLRRELVHQRLSGEAQIIGRLVSSGQIRPAGRFLTRSRRVFTPPVIALSGSRLVALRVLVLTFVAGYAIVGYRCRGASNGNSPARNRSTGGSPANAHRRWGESQRVSARSDPLGRVRGRTLLPFRRSPFGTSGREDARPGDEVLSVRALAISRSGDEPPAPLRSYNDSVKTFATGKISQAAAKYGQNAPMAATCCNACRTCVQTNLIALGLAAAVGAGAFVARIFRRTDPA